MGDDQLIGIDIGERVALLCIDNPPVNALSMAAVDALGIALRRVLADSRVKAIVVTGKGDLFSAGANVKELAALEGGDAALEFSRKGQTLCDAIEAAPKPVIAAINGRYAMGGGAELLMACHLRLIEESTLLGNPEVHLGLMVGWGGSQRLPRLVGAGRALDLLLTGRRISAREAEGIGLVNRVVADGTVVDEALTIARGLARLSGPVLGATLAAVRTGLRVGFARGQAIEAALFGSLCENRDWREGTGAFLEKRQAQFIDG